MTLSRIKSFLKAAPILCATAALLALWAPRATTQQGPPDVNWRTYGGEITNTRYSPLSQIDASNFSKLQVAWTFSTANFGPTPETNLESTPLVIDGLLYSTVGNRRDVVALDAATGEVVPKSPPGVSPAADCLIGPTGTTGASSTSRRAIA
jgi:quinoprotein glucose dehydrogenase